jgi:hypothetical protein
MFEATGSISVKARVDAKGLRLLSVGLASVSLADVLAGVGVPGASGISTDGLLTIGDASLRYAPSIAGALGGRASAVGVGQQGGPRAAGRPRRAAVSSHPCLGPLKTLRCPPIQS